MADTGQERTELATPRRRREARERGQVARSVELSSFLVLLASLLALAALAPQLGGGLGRFLVGGIDAAFTVSLDAGTLPILSRLWVGEALRLLAPLWLILLVVGIAASVAQVGFNVNGSLLAPKPERIDPVAGFRRLFSKRSGFELAKSLVKMAMLLAITWWTLSGRVEAIVGLSGLELGPALVVLGKTALLLAGRLILLLVVLAGADYAFQRWQHEQDIMMTPQELKEEYKETEGDPLLKSRLRALQREMSLRRMMEDVKRADVVVTNPTHFAVALRYQEREGAPRVLAKGADLVAARIRETAQAAKVPVVENAPLARALFAECEIGETIPLKLFQAVAELLAYVYRLRPRGAGAGA